MSVAELMWPYVERSAERLVQLFEGLDDAGRTWVPAAQGANSIAALVNHTISNAEDNLIGTVGGGVVTYERQVDFDQPVTDPALVRQHWEAVRGRFRSLLPSLTDAVMLESVSHPRRGSTTRIETLLVVARHAAEHLGHAELTRDLYEAGG